MTAKKKILLILVALLTALLPSLPAHADGIVIPDPPPDVPIADVPFLTTVLRWTSTARLPPPMLTRFS
jgi:hypothetical protein